MFPAVRQFFVRSLLVAAVIALAGCAVAKPRTDDPWQSFNRKAYAFNRDLDKAVIRPAAVGYRKVTTPGVREHVNDFFDTILLPVAVANDLLQAKPQRALKTSGRFVINMTLGFFGVFDPASHFGLPEDNNDFGVTLARWGVPDGPYVVLPLLGPSTARDFWRLPVDSYFFDPMSIYARTHSFHYAQQYVPNAIYLLTLRSRALDAESFLESAYDPYVFLRDAYRQRRQYLIYYGNPPNSVIERMQGLDQQNFNPDELLEQQREWEQKQRGQPAAPASAGGSPAPAPASTSGR
jgi:phospholipid-binding lipoprotein MlaA